LLILLEPDKFLSLSESQSISNTMQIAQNISQTIKHMESQNSSL